MKKNKDVLVFIKTFLFAFLIVTVTATPLFTLGHKVAEIVDSNPGGDDVPVLAKEWDYVINPDSPFFDAFTNTARVNILLLGVNEFEGLTDTIMLASFDTDNRKLDVISIPRDTYYYRDGLRDSAQHKINAAYRRNPVNSAIAVSEILMDIPINYYAVLNYTGAANIVDAMGGVPMDIPFYMRYDDPYDKPPLHINLQRGYQLLDGEKAIQFLRFRKGNDGYQGYPDADLGRIKAHQQFMQNALKQCIGIDLPIIATAIFNNVESDITIGDALYLARKAIGLRSEDMRTHTMPASSVGAYVQPDKEKIAELLIEIYSIKTESGEEEDEEA